MYRNYAQKLFTQSDLAFNMTQELPIVKGPNQPVVIPVNNSVVNNYAKPSRFFQELSSDLLESGVPATFRIRAGMRIGIPELIAIPAKPNTY